MKKNAALKKSVVWRRRFVSRKRRGWQRKRVSKRSVVSLKRPG
ncbi:hypothetical protein [Myxococcus virescens]|nr:hypothetical protein [Myxococcus virescens]